jgi:DNA-binding response OmpR family regulator
MYANNLRPSEIIARQREVIAQQESIIETLKAALAASSVTPVAQFQPWMKGLTPQERALVGALYESYPNAIGKYDLLDILPGQDHVEDRQVQLVSVKVHHLRKKLGADAIENVWGEGYRLGERFYDEIRQPGDSVVEPHRRLAMLERRLAA